MVSGASFSCRWLQLSVCPKVVNPDPKSPGDTYMTYVGSDDIYHWNQGDLLKVKVTEVGPTGLASFLYSVFGLNMAPVDFTLAGRIRS